MKKIRYVFYSVLIVLLVGAGTVGWFWRIVSKTNLRLDVQHLGEVTFVPWEYIRAGILSRQLQLMYLDNKFDTAKVPTYPILFTVTQSSKEDLEKYGIGLAMFSSPKGDEVKSVYGTFSYLGILRTQYRLQKYLVLVEQWIGQNNTPRYLYYLFPESRVKDGEIDQYLNAITTVDEVPILMPIVRYLDESQCEKYTKGDKKYCGWYINVQNRLGSALDHWSKQGEILEELGRYPLWMSTSI